MVSKISTCQKNGDRTKHPRTKHPMPFFATLDKTSHRFATLDKMSHAVFVTRTKHPMPFLPPWTKHPMPFLTPGQNIPLSGIFSGNNTLDKSSYFLDKSGQGSCFYNIFMKYIYELMMIYNILSLTNRVVSHCKSMGIFQDAQGQLTPQS